jgi:MFS family permease
VKQASSGRYILALLLVVNLLNYIDRQVLFAVFPLIKADLSLTDTDLGKLGSAFMLSYMVSAPLFGWIGDALSRTRLAAGGLFLWSLATAMAGFTRSYGTLLSARAAVGIGEASFGTVSPGLLAEHFPKEKRGRILSYFYLAIPVGSALGYLAGGNLGQHFGWHSAFLLVGLPGLIFVIPVLLLREPRHQNQPDATTAQREPLSTAYRKLLGNRSFLINTLAMAAMTFALGGLAQWLPSFLNRIHHLDVARASTLFGAITVLAGITGTLAGGWLGDRCQQRNCKGYLLVSGWGFICGAPIACYALLSRDLTLCMTAIFCAEFFLFFNTGPLNTVIVNVTQPETRAMAFAVNIFLIHALGDAISPTIIGKISDMWDLGQALLITPVAILVAAFFCFLCCRYVTGDMARVKG